MTELVLSSSSVADDLGFIALADVASILQEDTPHRLIGGHMVTAIAAHHRLGADLFRETADVDLGVPPIVITKSAIPDRLRGLGYELVSGCRFERPINDLASRSRNAVALPPRATIDILVPGYTSRLRDDRQVGELVTTEVPGLAEVMKRPGIPIDLRMVRLDGSSMQAHLVVPDEVGAFTVKVFASTVRDKASDVVDAWRCLELLAAAKTDPGRFGTGEPAEAARIARALFDDRSGSGMADLASERGLNGEAADALHTRLQALMARHLGRG